jgi:DDE family transposase
MITNDHPLLQLLALIDLVWVETGSASAKVYSDQTMFKIYMVSVLKQLWSRRSLGRYLSGMPLVAAACGLVRIPDRRTLDRRLAEIAPQAETQIQALGLVLSLEAVSDATVAASDGSAFATPGPVWHKQDKAAGIVPEGLHGLDKEADWIQSTYHGWVYGYKAHVTISVAPTTVRAVLNATVTGSACESHILQARIERLPPLVRLLLLDAGYDAADLIALCAQYGIQVLAPLSKPIGKSTSQDRRERAAYLNSPEGKARYQQRGCSIEPFFATLKDFFHLDPLPVQGKTLASVVILLALYAWNLVVLLNFVSHRPLGAVKPILDLL